MQAADNHEHSDNWAFFTLDNELFFKNKFDHKGEVML
jgi:hypothetical protein